MKAVNKNKGIRPLVLGIVITLLALLNIFLSAVTNTAIDPFYLLLALFGIFLVAIGLWRKRSQVKVAE